MGKLWDVVGDRIKLPYRYTMRVAIDEEPRFYGWYPGSDLMTQSLVDLLLRNGVDNLQIFPCEIKREKTEEEITGFSTVNIVGRVSCANLSQSSSMPVADSHYFERLVIDIEKTNGQLVFRVDESPMVVLVHEKIANAISNSDIFGLSLEPVEVAT